jgi:hypothetical protein
MLRLNKNQGKQEEIDPVVIYYVFVRLSKRKRKKQKKRGLRDNRRDLIGLWCGMPINVDPW